MEIQELLKRVNNCEVVIVDNINSEYPERFVTNNPQYFVNLTVENDVEKADVVWVYNKELRSNHEYNPQGK